MTVCVWVGVCALCHQTKVSLTVTEGAVAHGGSQWWVGWGAPLERGEAARERRLQLGGQEDAQLRDDAACDQLVRGHVERRVPHLHACRGAEVKGQ